MADETQGMSPEDFGLGADLDDVIAEANADDAVDGTGGSGDGEDLKASRTDFQKLKMILDVPLRVSVELGRTKMLINDLLQLGQGSVIELDKIAGEPMEILINNKTRRYGRGGRSE